MEVQEKKKIGRPRKYQTDEERKEARRRYNANARQRRKENQQMVSSGFLRNSIVIQFDDVVDRDDIMTCFENFIKIPFKHRILTDVDLRKELSGLVQQSQSHEESQVACQEE